MFGCPVLRFYCIYQYAVKMLLLNVSPTLLTALVFLLRFWHEDVLV